MAKEPTIAELEETLAGHVHPGGTVPAGIAAQLASEYGWSGRMIDILAALADTSEKMGYLAGGRRPDEVATWLSIWAESPLSLDDIEVVMASGGWEPDPFVVLARAGLLETFLRNPTGHRGASGGSWLEVG